MREMGIAAVFPGPNLSRRALEHRIYPYLLRGIAANTADHIWGIDITYIRMEAGWLYLVAILDWFTRYIVSWELDDTLELDFVLSAVDRALQRGKPTIWNSDQGSHFTSQAYLTRCRAARSRSAWTARAGRSTTSSPNVCGEPSSTRKFTSDTALLQTQSGARCAGVKASLGYHAPSRSMRIAKTR